MPSVKGKGGGKRPGAGRKSKAEEMGLKALLDECITEAERRSLFRKLLAAGKKGDVKATGLLLAYIYGKPVERHEHSGENGAPIPISIIEAKKPDA